MTQGSVAIPKEALSQLEAARYDGEIKVVETEEGILEALSTLKEYGKVGFDTETKPSFKKGYVNKVSLVQLATPDITYLLRINKTGFTKSLIDFLENPDILKIGLSIKDDFHNLAKINNFEPENFIDLQPYVKNFLIADNSLSKIYAILFGRRICKGQRLTNWEADPLTESQQQYAALDAAACLEIYNHLEAGKFDPLSSPYYSISEQSTSINENNINPTDQ